MNKIIIGALIAIITWELGAHLAQKFEHKTATISQKIRTTSEKTAPEAPETAPPARREPAPVLAAPKAQKPEEAKEEPKEQEPQIDWPPTAEVNDMRDNVEYELPDLDHLVETLKLKRTFLWDRDQIVNRTIAQNVDRDSIIQGNKMPSVFPWRARVVAMEKELVKVSEHSRIGEDPAKSNPWTHLYFDKAEIPPQANEGEAYCYYIYDPQGMPGFNDEINKIVDNRDRRLTSNIMTLDSRIRGHNAQNYWEMWWVERQYQHKLKILESNLKGLRQRIRNIPTGWVKISNRFRNVRYEYKVPEEFEQFIEQEAEIVDYQIHIVETLLRGSK